MPDPSPNLTAAYDLSSTEDARRLYQNWASDYDQSFGAAMGYAAPRRVAERFLAETATQDVPVLDIGAGTGLIGESMHGLTIDALDLSPKMLEVAADKGVYRSTIEADLTQALPIADATYGGFVSAGTFTHGHVGPACLPELLRIARTNALFVCGVVPEVYDGMGFGSALARLQAAGLISPLRFAEMAIYEGATHDHAKDRALIMVFRKT